MAVKPLDIFYQNVRGLRTKSLEFYRNLLKNNFDIILITETWLTTGVLDGEVCDSRYDLFRLDRNYVLTNTTRGGGVMVLVRRELEGFLPGKSNVTPPTEMIWVTIPAKSFNPSVGKNLHIALVYISPDSNSLPQHVDNVLKSVSYVYNLHKNDNFLVVGDFNMPNIQWIPHLGPLQLKRGPIETQTASQLLLDEFNIIGLEQSNYSRNSFGNTLDLIFGNFCASTNASQISLVKEDTAHPTLSIDATNISLIPLKECYSTKYNFRKCNYDQIVDYLHKIDWRTIFESCNDVDCAVNCFNNELHKCIGLFVPKINSKKNNTLPIWYNKSLSNIIHEKLKAHAKWKRFKNYLDYQEFSILRARAKKLEADLYSNFITNIQEDIKICPKKMWNYVKLMKGKSNYPKTLSLGPNIYNNGPDICNGFNKFFESVFVKPSMNYNLTELDLPPCSGAHAIGEVVICKKQLLKLLKATDINKSAGTDSIPPVFIHKCAEALVEPLNIIFSRSLSDGIFPMKWKEANIIPIHKKASKSKIENYRPISILNTFSKIFEKIVYDQIYDTIINGVSQTQHGFLRGRSTLGNLAEFTQFVLENMEGGGQVDVVYTDFEKAFDRVDHIILLAKLDQLGIHGDLLRWVKSYLTKRAQAVVVGGFRSDLVDIPSGIPQGSHLGPLFYNAYIYDIYKCFTSCKHLLYADDKKIFCKINNIQDSVNLQNTLNRLSEYYSYNKIIVNVPKCQQISFTRKPKPLNFTYTFNNIPIVKVNVIRDLGVLLDSKLTMSEHVDYITDKAYKNLGFVIRTCKPFFDVSCIKTVYYAYVRSVLEYASSIWYPNYVIYNDKVERIQKKFIKHLNYRKRIITNYQEGCTHHKLMSLKDRRNLMDAMFLYNILNNNLDSPTLLASINFSVPTRRTRHTPLFSLPHLSTNYAMNAPVNRICAKFNKIFSSVDIFNTSKYAFKKAITDILLTQTF